MASPRTRRLSIIGFTMILVIVPFCLYYLFFVESQNGYFTKRNFRVLADIGDQIKSKIDNLGTSSINAVKNAVQVKKEIVRLTGTKSEKKDEKGQPEKPADKKPEDKLKSSIALIDKSGTSLKYDPNSRAQQPLWDEAVAGTQRQIRIPRARPSNSNTSGATTVAIPGPPPPPMANANIGRVISNSRPAPSNATASNNSRARTRTRLSSSSPGSAAAGPAPTVTLSVKAEQGSFWLNLEYQSGKTPGLTNVVFKSEITKLFDPFVARYVIDDRSQTQNPLFDEVLVAEQQDGRVIFEHGQPGLSIVSLDSLRNDKGGKLELELANQSSSLANVQLAGADYKLFVQPVRLTFSTSGDDKNQGVRWVVCGLTRTDHFRDQTYAVSYTVLIIFTFAALLAALSWPLLKLRLMGPKDRLRRGDFALTTFSALMGTALLTFLLVDVYTYVNLEKTLDTQLKDLALSIRSNIRQELGSVLAQLRRFDKRANKTATGERSGALADLHASKLRPIKTTKDNAKKVMEFTKNLLAGKLNLESAAYPYFNSVTWADATGLQRIKWTTRPEPTASLNVSDRSYFTNARDGNVWKLSHGGREYEYAFEPVHSMNTGENVAIVSTRVPDSNWVSNIDTRLASLMGTVLPPGHGYAVIDSTGAVLFHSDEVNNLEEQFFEECDNDRLLRAAVLARASEFINAQYLGKGHRLFVSPISDTPWMLVVFRDKQMARTINLELLTLSLVLYLVFAVVALLVVSIVYMPRGGDRIRRLWPNKRNAGRYDRLIAMNAVLVVVFLIVAWKVKNEALLVFCWFLFPSLATVLGALVLTGASAGHAKSESADRLRVLSWLTYRKGYAIALVGSLILMSVLPALGFFQIGRNFEMRLMVKHGQVSLARALERRAARIDAQYASINIGSNEKEKNAFLDSRLDPLSPKSNLDIYDSFFFTTFHPGPDFDASLFVPQQPGKLDAVLTSLRPIYNQTCVESQELARGESADGLWRWEEDALGRFRLQKGKDGRNGEMSLALVSNVPPFDMPNTIPKWLLVILALGGMCVLMYQLVRFVTRHFFHLDKDAPRAMAEVLNHLSPTNNVAVLRPPMAVNGNGWEPENSHKIDLSRVSIWPGWANMVKPNVPATGQTVVLDNFEHDMDNPAANHEKLQAIEQFLSAGRRVVVLSTVDPLRFSLSAGDDNPAASPNGVGKEAPTEPGAKGEKKPEPAATSTKSNAAEGDQATARWSMAFSTFVTVYSHDNAETEFVEKNPGFLRVMNTNRPWRYLERIGKGIGRNGASHTGERLDRAAREEQINEVVDQARAYHQALWATCSQDERCALIHLALDGMISSKNTDVRQLMKRGLVVRDPGLRLMDESFRRFVLSASQGEDIDAWRHAGGSNWELIKAPLLLILLSVAVFLFVTQKDVYDSSVSFLSALTAGLAALFKLLGMFQKKSSGPVDA